MGKEQLDPWLQLDAPLVYEKELLPVGKLTKWIDGEKKVMDADISRSFIDNVVTQFDRFQKANIRVPLFKTHKEDPDNKRGQVRSLYVKPNSRGVDSLFSKIEFDNQAAADVGKRNEVSVLIPPKFRDSNDNRYQWPLRHVAITSTPVLSGLDDWNGPVVLAYENEYIGDDNVELKPLLSELSLDQSGTAEEQLSLAVGAIKDLKSQLEVSHQQLALALENDGEEEITLSFPPVLMKQFRGSREAIISGLMLGPNPVLSPTLGKQIKDKYCNEDTLRLDLSQDKEETEFDRTIELAKAIAKDRPLPNSGRRTIKASNEAEGNPLLAGAQARADQAAKRAAATVR